MSRREPKRTDIQVGDRVRYYSRMNPLDHLKGETVVTRVCPMHDGGDDMVWLLGVSGAWHPDACEVVEKAD